MAAVNVQFVLRSKNSKTGEIPVTTSDRGTCPPDCPFIGDGGCYAEAGPWTRLNWNKVTEGTRGGSWSDLCTSVRKLPDAQIWRHDIAGDLPHDDGQLDEFKVHDLVAANIGKMGFTYTHHNMKIGNNAEIVLGANRMGFTINLSANSPAHADELMDLCIGPVVTVCAGDQTENFTTPAGRKVVICPATQRDDVTCKTCKICARQRTVIVAFPVHGRNAKNIEV